MPVLQHSLVAFQVKSAAGSVMLTMYISIGGSRKPALPCQFVNLLCLMKTFRRHLSAAKKLKTVQEVNYWLTLRRFYTNFAMKYNFQLASPVFASAFISTFYCVMCFVLSQKRRSLTTRDLESAYESERECGCFEAMQDWRTGPQAEFTAIAIAEKSTEMKNRYNLGHALSLKFSKGCTTLEVCYTDPIKHSEIFGSKLGNLRSSEYFVLQGRNVDSKLYSMGSLSHLRNSPKRHCLLKIDSTVLKAFGMDT